MTPEDAARAAAIVAEHEARGCYCPTCAEHAAALILAGYGCDTTNAGDTPAEQGAA